MAGKKKPKPKVPTRPFLTHGGKTIQIPIFSGPVGPDVPDLRQKFPTLNTARDVETVQYYLSELIDIHYLKVPGSLPWLDKCQVNPTVDAGLIEAIKQFQTKMKIGDSQETSRQLIKPDGETLKALVDYGDYSAKLEELKLKIKDPADYIFYGSFDVEKLIRLYKAAFSGKPNYTEATEPNLRRLVAFMTNDPYIVDIRWMAYILATVVREATAPMTETHKNAQGKTVTQRPWRMMWAPVEESGHGSGRSYEKPVKVFALADGNLRVTEWDGDQWTVKPDGSNKAITAGARPGTSPSMAAPVKTYTDDPGTESAYFGRGYVQLTWWFNYATAGIHIGKGTSLLTDPSQALDPDTSYQLMSYCLRTGFGFANKHKLGDYMYAGLTNYKGARAMVNGTDHADEIAANAKEFERILMDARN
ncbi:MAG TPA: hypothetical protein VH325_01850 [Bryobacteraceae bacterium]|jgi:hypothetical protein|nr:hypothetical protein [Bryobacteraceae bacterium]